MVEQLGLTVVPAGGKLSLADDRAQIRRIGTTTTTVTCMFLGGDEKTCSLTWTFEVIKMDPEEPYDYIAGRDLLKVLFPKDIPAKYYPVDTTQATIRQVSTEKEAKEIQQQPSHDTIAFSTEGKDSMQIVSGLRELQANMHDSGAGILPQYEQPRMSRLETSKALEEEYTEQREALMTALAPMIMENAAITGFCVHPDAVVELKVDPTKTHTLNTRQYPIPVALLPVVKEVINRWLLTGKIKKAPVSCPYNNPLLVVPKKDENGQWTGIRVCLDVRKVNAALLEGDAFPMPKIDEAFNHYVKCSIFGEFDLAEAYLQFQMHPESQKYTAFTFDHVQYVFVGCPFGLSLLPSYYQRVMSDIFRELPFTQPYIDNLPFGSRSWTEHGTHAKAILAVCTKYNLRLKPPKLGSSALTVLGRRVSLEGIGLDPVKLEALEKWPLPANYKEMQRFLGFVGWLHGNVRHFAELAAPLHDVVAAELKQVDYTTTQGLLLKEHFNRLKEAIRRSPLLQYPDYMKPFHLATDASNTGIGAVLFQPKSDNEYITPHNIVGFYSHKLTPSEYKYGAYRKELLAVVRSLVQFHHCLFGRADTVLITDHMPLTYLQSSPVLNPTLGQWLDTIQNYQFKIVHRPGALHVQPDQLSRMYGDVYAKTPAWGVPSGPSDAFTSASSSQIVCDSIEEAQAAAQKREARRIVRPIRVKTTPTAHVMPENVPTPLQSTIVSTIKGEGKHTQTDKDIAALVEMEKRGMKAPDTTQAKEELIHRYHEFGHFGRHATYRRLYADGYWWPKMRDMIDKELQKCDACIRFVVTKSGYHPAQAVVAHLPGDHWQLDCSTHMPPTPDGYTAILHVIDVFTGMMLLLKPMKAIKAEQVALELFQLMVLVGPPKIIQSDNGGEFTNDTIVALVKLIGVKQTHSVPYHPQAQGKVERSIQSTVMIVKKLLHGTLHHWPLFLPFAQIQYNWKISALTGSSPFALFFGRAMNELKDYTGEADPEDGKAIDMNDWREHQEKLLSLVYPAISDRIRCLKGAMKSKLDKLRRLLTKSLPTGARVVIKDPTRKDKFEPKYIGPYTIIRRAQNGAYVLRDDTGDILDRHVSIDQIKMYSRETDEEDEKRKQETYDVDFVSDHSGSASDNSLQFLTHWVGYEEPTWVASEDFDDDSPIRAYWQRVKNGQPHVPRKSRRNRRKPV
jgi:transposase InsO family protein